MLLVICIQQDNGFACSSSGIMTKCFQGHIIVHKDISDKSIILDSSH